MYNVYRKRIYNENRARYIIIIIRYYTDITKRSKTPQSRLWLDFRKITIVKQPRQTLYVIIYNIMKARLILEVYWFYYMMW